MISLNKIPWESITLPIFIFGYRLNSIARDSVIISGDKVEPVTEKENRQCDAFPWNFVKADQNFIQ